MLKVTVNKKTEHVIVFENDAKGIIDGITFEWDVTKIKDGSYHVIKNNRSYKVEVLKVDALEKKLVVFVNGNNYELKVRDEFDALLKKFGFDNLKSNKINELKAPMPGLVLDIRVSEGETVKSGDALLVLEAMKMENIIKSPTDGVIKKINVKTGVAVEKNQVLINFV
ncbi:MAG: acetyl-CoA carboxylase biotin carboxyl carrier protein subunit [Bacteroidia bacterium]